MPMRAAIFSRSAQLAGRSVLPLLSLFLKSVSVAGNFFPPVPSKDRRLADGFGVAAKSAKPAK